ncbi:hypothetical protein AAFF_G00297610 [Aldrovandia affinis]|uniref:Transferrin-like domain-containing protein n=1 Tax=Aldrovandia affinis TaxID=143900 RepID=A0AAD7WRY7_9TELE|nr:hypothetical protein AAFF_G00297610 [Aldrovandia affinis]
MSDAEKEKCDALAAKVPRFACVQREGAQACIKAIARGEADAITLDAGNIFEAGLRNYNLHPIIAEYSGQDSETCYVVVAVAKKDTGFGFKDLKGKKSCHTGVGKAAGWHIPIGTLLSQGQIIWEGMEDMSIVQAVSEFFSASCVPGLAKANHPNLCQLCKNDCSHSHKETYYGHSGAFHILTERGTVGFRVVEVLEREGSIAEVQRIEFTLHWSLNCSLGGCLRDGAGDVAFVGHLTLPDTEKAGYELLCKDGSRKSMDDYASCHLGKVPGQAVVSRKDPDLAARIWDAIQMALQTDFPLFSSVGYRAQNLLFKDSTSKLVQLPKDTDSFLYLGAEYVSIIHSLHKDMWSVHSIDFNTYSPKLQCIMAASLDDCIKKVMRKEADALTVDGGGVYSAGKCGLVPAMVEQYDSEKCASKDESSSSYYSVAVVKNGSGLTRAGLKGKKSCNTRTGSTVSWTVPMGIIHKGTGECDFCE